MGFLGWYGFGAATIVILLFVEAYRNNRRDRRIKHALSELYNILFKKADWLSTGILLLMALGGPLLIIAIIYFIVRNWYDNLDTDDDDKKIYPWNDDE